MSASPARRAPRSHRPAAPQTRLRGSGTATPERSITQTVTALNPDQGPDGLVLRLRGAHSPQPTSTAEQSEADEQQETPRRRTIQWAEDVVDNEGLGRKKSKVCCIFHKSREVGESSSEEDSSSSDDSDGSGSSGADDGAARPVGGRRRGRRKGRGRRHEHEHGHKDGEDCGHGHGHAGKKKPSPNAYERMPRYDVKPLERQPGT